MVLSPWAEGRRDATFLDPQRLGLASGGAGGVSLWPVGEDAWVARFLPVWLLGSTLSGSVWRAAGPAAFRSGRSGKVPGWPASCRFGSWTCSIPR